MHSFKKKKKKNNNNIIHEIHEVLLLLFVFLFFEFLKFILHTLHCDIHVCTIQTHYCYTIYFNEKKTKKKTNLIVHYI